jgi:hypothetical protein
MTGIPAQLKQTLLVELSFIREPFPAARMTAAILFFMIY